MNYEPEPLKHGANSPREEALLELKMENAEQQQMNNIFGGRRSRSRSRSINNYYKNKYTRKNNSKYRNNKSERISILKSKKKIASLFKKKKELKILINKIKRHMKNKSMKNKSMKNKRYYGGADEFEVPQFHGSPGGNNSSIQLNGLLLKGQQDAIHDE